MVECVYMLMECEDPDPLFVTTTVKDMALVLLELLDEENEKGGIPCKEVYKENFDEIIKFMNTYKHPHGYYTESTYVNGYVVTSMLITKKNSD